MPKNDAPSLKIPIVISCLLSVAAIGIAGYQIMHRDKIGYVDSFRLLTEYKGTLVAKAVYERKVAVWKANIDTLNQELNRDVLRYSSEKLKLSASERKTQEDQIAVKQNQLESYRKAVTDNATKEDQEVTAKVFQEISQFLKKYGKKNGYDMILGSSSSGNIVFGQEEKNLTEEVLKQLNAEFESIKR